MWQLQQFERGHWVFLVAVSPHHQLTVSTLHIITESWIAVAKYYRITVLPPTISPSRRVTAPTVSLRHHAGGGAVERYDQAEAHHGFASLKVDFATGTGVCRPDLGSSTFLLLFSKRCGKVPPRNIELRRFGD